MMYYRLRYNIDVSEELEKRGEGYIYAETSNLNQIEYPGIKKGWFNTIDLTKLDTITWPDNVDFYYNSELADVESDYLLNVNNWLIVHKRVKSAMEKMNVKGVKFYNINLIDKISKAVNYNYCFVYIENFIDAYDMNKSKYIYNEKYDLYNFMPMNLVIDGKKCEGYDIFRCEKDKVAVYVSKKIYNMAIENKFTGFAFYEQLVV